ncbi:sialate O-acetylesterase [Tichowtungia aerotolerans]|uniref:Acetyl xylan esterase n=1 Tax=Tichowtungia aerotolerans TaxID=2697043 RepID=A0A6P1MCT2_9BACT|nr:sialate O-acetylesterase [Tichowtungia aerotolerans]QHI70384.1 acetyl xylan esterase [Tichowtungia aerotolerans]
MRKIKNMVLIAIMAAAFSAGAAGKHLFILSGQSNMQGLDPQISFVPAVEEEFGKDNVIVVKDAMGGQPILRWYKQFKAPDGTSPAKTGDLYDRLMEKVNAAIDGERLKSVTFIWMQGERDAREKNGDVYAESLRGLRDQLAADLDLDDLNFVIGRISDFDMTNRRYPHWTKVREAQVEVADSCPRAVWVDCDDLNSGLNSKGRDVKDDLHMSIEGYKILGQRFADAAIELIQE